MIYNTVTYHSPLGTEDVDAVVRTARSRHGTYTSVTRIAHPQGHSGTGGSGDIAEGLIPAAPPTLQNQGSSGRHVLPPTQACVAAAEL